VEGEKCLPAKAAGYSTRPIEGGSKASHCCNAAKIAFQQSEALSALRAIFAVQLGFCAKSAQNTSRFRWVCTLTTAAYFYIF